MNELAAWILTYLVHSTLLIGGVVLALRLVDVRAHAWREAIWMVALFGAPITTTAQRLDAAEPIGGTWAIGADPEELLAFEPEVVAGSNVAFGPAAADDFAGARSAEASASPVLAAPSLATRAGRALRRLAELAPPVEWSLAVLAVSILFVLGLLRSLRGLAHRRPLEEGELRARLDRLRLAHAPRRAVRLSTSTRLDSPVAFGLLNPEICVPERVLRELDSAQQEAMLAHELAHVVRNDPLRLLLARLVEAIFFFQPLNRLARKRLFETVERRCDAWAIARTGRGLALAECLAEVATWIHERGAPAAAAAMAESGSPLKQRIEGLLEPERTLDDDRRRRAFAPCAALLLPALMVAAPQVRSATPPVDAPFSGEVAVVDAPADEVAVAPDDEIAVAIAAAIDLLDAEVETLAEEVRGLRRMLPPDRRVDEGLLRSLAAVERRIERFQTRRDQLAAWKNNVLRERGLAPTQRFELASPWSEGR